MTRPGDPYLDLVDEALHDRAVRDRAEARDRRWRSADVATWTGTLRDLAERAATVVVATSSGRAHRGPLVRVTADHLLLEGADGPVVVACSAVRCVRPDPGARFPPALGDRPPAHGRTIVEVLETLLEDRRPVTVTLQDRDETLHGRVVGLGEDVVSLRLGDTARSVVYLPIAAIAELLVSGSGFSR